MLKTKLIIFQCGTSSKLGFVREKLIFSIKCVGAISHVIDQSNPLDLISYEIKIQQSPTLIDQLHSSLSIQTIMTQLCIQKVFISLKLLLV